MRIVPERSLWAQLATFLAAMILGPVVALGLALMLAPASDLVHAASVIGFGAVFVGGLLVWMGIGVVTVAAGFFANLVRGPRPGAKGLAETERAVPAGYRAFALLGAVLGGSVGLLAGVVTPMSVPAATIIWGTAGVAYGAALSLAAHTGYLPFPEPE